MAAVPATITVNFISNYAGPHRICWRQGNTGPYDCSTVVACAGGGNPCSGVIPITVDNESCEPVTYEGYVQAACEVEGSLNGRIPFTVTFTPNPTCKMYTVTCTAVPVNAIQINNVGVGYAPGTTPALIFTGGGGSGAAGNAIISDGAIAVVAIDNGGAGYLGGGSGTITNVPATTVTGVGTGALFEIIVNAGVITGWNLANYEPLNGGSGYAASDEITFDNTYFGGTGAGVVFKVTSVNTGNVLGINLTNGGSGYTSEPVVTINATPATLEAELQAILGTCSQLNLGNDCTGTPIPIQFGLPLFASEHACGLVAPTPAAGYSVTEEGNCYCCSTISITGGEGGATWSYIDCATRTLVTGTVANAEVLGPFCAVTDSWEKVGKASISAAPGCV